MKKSIKSNKKLLLCIAIDAPTYFFLILCSLLFFKIAQSSENDVQIASICYYSRVSVIRGQVITPQGLGIIGIRVSVDKDSRFGFTLTRSGGW
jgi:hypothetical protein